MPFICVDHVTHLTLEVLWNALMKWAAMNDNLQEITPAAVRSDCVLPAHLLFKPPVAILCDTEVVTCGNVAIVVNQPHMSVMDPFIFVMPATIAVVNDSDNNNNKEAAALLPWSWSPSPVSAAINVPFPSPLEDKQRIT
jgi:hypothetical protein